MHKGKIILVPLPFTDLSGHKVRPALVLHSGKGEDFIACFISSKQNAKGSISDIPIKPNVQNGLKENSIIKIAKMATLEKRIVLGEIGFLDKAALSAIDKKLKEIFSL